MTKTRVGIEEVVDLVLDGNIDPERARVRHRPSRDALDLPDHLALLVVDALVPGIGNVAVVIDLGITLERVVGQIAEQAGPTGHRRVGAVGQKIARVVEIAPRRKQALRLGPVLQAQVHV